MSYWTWTVAVVDEHSQRRRSGDTEGGEQRENLGFAFHGGIRCFWAFGSKEVGKGCKERRRRSGKQGWVHRSLEERASEDKIPQGSQPCFQHRSERKCQLALECRQNRKNPPVANTNLEINLLTKIHGR